MAAKNPQAALKGQARTKTGAQAGHRRDTARQNELRERAFYLHIEGWSVRAIGAELGIDKTTAAKYVREETAARGKELAEARDHATAMAVAKYQYAQRRAVQRADVSDAILERIRDEHEFNGKVTDHSLGDFIKAQERIDKVLGIESAIKIDAGLDALVEALILKGE